MAYIGKQPAAIAVGVDSSSIEDLSIVNIDISNSAAIAVSKTALVAGTGITLSTNTLGVDAAQTQITSIGTIGTGTWEATDVAIAHGGTGASTASAARTALFGATDLAIADGGTGASAASSARTSLGVAIGSDVQAYDAQLDSIAAWTAAQVTTLGTIGTVTTGANQMIYTTGADTFAAASITAVGLAILDDANITAQRATLGLVIGSDVQAYDAQLADLAGLGVTNSNFIVGDGNNWVAESGATARTSLGVDVAGTDNSTNVTLTGTPDYITISGQVITRGQIDIGDDTNLAAGSGITLTGDTLNVDAAQTVITSIYATDLILGEDSQTAIDFGTANEIDFKINNTTELTLDASALYPTGNAGLDLGTSSLEFKDAFFDGTVTSDAFAGPLTGNVTGDITGNAATVTTNANLTGDVTSSGNATSIAAGVIIDADVKSDAAIAYSKLGTIPTWNQNTTGTAARVTITDSTTNANYDIPFTDGSSSLLEDDAAFYYNPSTGTLRVPNLNVAGTTTQVDTVTMNAQNAVIFEGATADDYETTLSIVDPTADHTQYLINQGGYIPVLAASTATAITATPAELNVMDADTVQATVTLVDGDGVVISDGTVMKQALVSDFGTHIASGTLTFTNKTFDVEATGNSIANIDVADFKAAAVVIESEGIGSNDNDTTLPTSAAVKDYVDTKVTAEDLDFQGDSGGALAIDLDSESLTIAGGTNATTVGSGNSITVNVDDAFLKNDASDTTSGTVTAGGFTTTGTWTFDETTSGTVGITTVQDSGTAFADNDTSFLTAAAVKDFVDDQITAEDLDFQGDSGGALSIDLNSETLTVAGGTGIDTSGSSNTITVAVDSTIAGKGFATAMAIAL